MKTVIEIEKEINMLEERIQGLKKREYQIYDDYDSHGREELQLISNKIKRTKMRIRELKGEKDE